MKLYLTLKFDRKIVPDQHYICPGGYEICCKNGRKIAFDFETYEGKVSDEDSTILYTTQKCLDTDSFPEAERLNETLKNGGFTGFEEFFVYTGEYDDPEIHLEQVLVVCFELDDASTFELDETQLRQVNGIISEN